MVICSPASSGEAKGIHMRVGLLMRCEEKQRPRRSWAWEKELGLLVGGWRKMRSGVSRGDLVDGGGGVIGWMDGTGSLVSRVVHYLYCNEIRVGAITSLRS